MEPTDDDLALLHWLRANGAKFDKVQWPAVTTVDGIRGAIAKQNISSMEPMFEIPYKVMMGLPHALASREVGQVISAEEELLEGDLKLALFIMSERGKGARSFWHPFLRTLPWPGSTMDWTEAELRELQHDSFSMRTRARRDRLRVVYERIFLTALAPKYPDLFSFVDAVPTNPVRARRFALARELKRAAEAADAKEPPAASAFTASGGSGGGVDEEALPGDGRGEEPLPELQDDDLGSDDDDGGGGGGGAPPAPPGKTPAAWWSFEAFAFAWGTIQARAFGRWLPWTALVPFADLLNHQNVSTRYHFEPPPCGEAVFRLFPTGGNRYAAGCEIFNSYGRRPNDNLLLEYGFAMLGNEWDACDVGSLLPLGAVMDASWGRRRSLLLRNGVSPVRPVKVKCGELCRDLLVVHRVLRLSLPALNAALPAANAEAFSAAPRSLRASSSGDGSGGGCGNGGGGGSGGSGGGPVAPVSSQPPRKAAADRRPPALRVRFAPDQEANPGPPPAGAAAATSGPSASGGGRKSGSGGSGSGGSDGDGGGGGGGGGKEPDHAAPVACAVPVDVGSELEVLAEVAGRLESWLGRQPTSLRVDEALLATLEDDAKASVIAVAKAAATAASSPAAVSGADVDEARATGGGSAGGLLLPTFARPGGAQAPLAAQPPAAPSPSAGTPTTLWAPRAPGAPGAAGPAVGNDRLLNAVRYRLTRKRLVARQLNWVAALHRDASRCARAALAPPERKPAARSALPPLASFDEPLRAHVAAQRAALLGEMHRSEDLVVYN